MSEEEQEAIEYWKRHIVLLHYNTQFASEHYATILLNYIDKLQKENEELKNADLTSVYMKGFYDSESKWKTKIRTKIKELEEKCETIKKINKGTYALNGNYLEAFYQIVILRELLGDDE